MSIHPIMQKLAAKLERTDLPAFAPATPFVYKSKFGKARKSAYRRLRAW